jgi:hypothetical protein
MSTIIKDRSHGESASKPSSSSSSSSMKNRSLFPLPLIPVPTSAPPRHKHRRAQRTYWRNIHILLLINLTLVALNRMYPCSHAESTSSPSSVLYNDFFSSFSTSSSSSSSASSSSPSSSSWASCDFCFSFLSSLQASNLFIYYQRRSSQQSRVLSFIRRSVCSLYSCLFMSSHVSCGTSPLISCPLTSSSSNINNLSFSSFIHCISHYVLRALLSESPSITSSPSTFHTSAPSDLPETPHLTSPSPSLSSFVHYLDSDNMDHYFSSHHAEFGYGTQQQSIVPLIASRVSLPDSIHSVPMLSVLPPHLTALYADPHRILIASSFKSSSSSLPATTPVTSRHQHHRARVNGDRHECISLIARMLSLGMVESTVTPIAVNSIFTVSKDVDADRLIIDARHANTYFIKCPDVCLPNPSHFAALTIPHDHKLVVCKSDLSNFYHHIQIPSWLRPYLALPSISRHELESYLTSSPSSSCMSSILANLTIGVDGMFYPMCTTLPMGWSHSVFIAQSIHEHILYSSLTLHPSFNITNLTSSTLVPGQPIHVIYVDDLSLIDVVPIHCAAPSPSSSICITFIRILQQYVTAHFPPKPSKVVHPTCDGVPVLGVLLHAGRVSVESSRMRRLLHDTIAMLRRVDVSGHELSCLIGCWTWVMLLRRPTLSILRTCYRYIAVANKKVFTLWHSVRVELAMLIAMAPLMYCELTSSINQFIVASDASDVGAGVVSTYTNAVLTHRMWPMYYKQPQHIKCENERWAFPHNNMSLSDDTLARYPPCHLTAICPTSSQPHQPSLHLLPSLNNPASMLSLIESSPWCTIISHAWHYRDHHINEKEAHAFLLSLRWLLSYPSSFSCRFFSLIDSSAVYYGLCKGRSSSSTLFGLFRRAAALLLSCDCRVMPLWISSKWNPADRPSRILMPT